MWGLADTSDKEMPRLGELVFKDKAEEPHTFNIFAHHQYSIPDGSYTLLGCRKRLTFAWRDGRGYRPELRMCEMWIVGQQRPDGKFEKLSVVSIDNDLKDISLPDVKMVLC